ncbi:MAG: choice-of-anchor L domain-containing protein [Flavobacteriales bacterium]|nr:choice-of-anchor L domain-containing protein [Flavobacteriales bacterium]MBP6696445.1 choice-of-anchor L domain-containing protein [Flavobacteriales bacterium]
MRMLLPGLLGLLIGCAVPVRAQLVLTNTQTPAQLVQNVLLGAGVSVSNITFNGTPGNTVSNQAGEFNSTNANVGIGAGVILATGGISNALGPNNSGSSSVPVTGTSIQDPDLLLLAQQSQPTIQDVNDCAVLEFDFVPTGDSLKFNFVFGSEEYLEFVNSINDAFGFFLSGPGITGPYSNNAINIALIPGTTDPVTINTVNDVVNPQFYVDNGNGVTPPYSTSPTYVQYDGLTTVMTALAQVICGETYHIKIVVGDANDTVWDSAVFLEAGSFQSNQISIVGEVVSGGIDSLFYEGCGTASLYLVRGGLLLDSDTVEILLGGSATELTDYTSVPAEVIFLPGQDSINIQFSAILDGLIEGQENILLMVINETGCGGDTVIMEIFIEEAPPIDVVMSNDVTVQCTDSTLISAVVTGGFGNYTLDWDQGVPDGQLSGWVTPGQTTTYVLTVTDDCGVLTESDAVTITVPIMQPLTVTVQSDVTVYCPETTVQLIAQVQGGTPGYSYQWTGNLGIGSTVQVAPVTTQSWSVTVTDLCGRDTSDLVTVTVDYDSVRVVIAPDTIICYGDTATLHAVTELGLQPYAYDWFPGGAADTLAVFPTSNTHYELTVTDACGISDHDVVGVGVNTPLAAFWWSGSTWVNNFPISFMDQSFGATSWWWDFGVHGLESTEQYPLTTYPDPGTYSVELLISDTLGCLDSISHTIVVDPEFELYIPNSFTPDGDGFNETWQVAGIGVKEFWIRLHDRWGATIFQSSDITTAWDGTLNGTPLPAGVYVYRYRVKAIEGEVQERMGHVTLLR